MSNTASGLNRFAFRDETLAFLLLRLYLAVRWIHAFVGKILTDEGTLSLGQLDGLVSYMQGAFEHKLPLFMVTPFAQVLPWIELVLGVALLIGFRSRNALVLSGLVFIFLAFGQMMLENWSTVSDIGFHLALVVGALLLVRHDRLNVMK